MGRIKLNLPERFIYATEIAIRISDINYGNHLGNDSLLSIMHEARVRFLQHFGFREKNPEGTGIIMTDVVINYKAEGKYGDILIVDISIGDINRMGCDIYYLIREKHEKKEIARAKTGIIFYDYIRNKRMDPPATFLEKFS